MTAVRLFQKPKAHPVAQIQVQYLVINDTSLAWSLKQSHCNWLCSAGGRLAGERCSGRLPLLVTLLRLLTARWKEAVGGCMSFVGGTWKINRLATDNSGGGCGGGKDRSTHEALDTLLMEYSSKQEQQQNGINGCLSRQNLHFSKIFINLIELI